MFIRYDIVLGMIVFTLIAFIIMKDMIKKKAFKEIEKEYRKKQKDHEKR